MKKIIINNDTNTINSGDLTEEDICNIVVRDSLGYLIGMVNTVDNKYRVTYKTGSISASFNRLELLMDQLSSINYTFHLLD